MHFDGVAQAASPSLSQDMQQLEAHVLTSCATDGLAKNMQREDQLIFALLHTFWEVRPYHHPRPPTMPKLPVIAEWKTFCGSIAVPCSMDQS